MYVLIELNVLSLCLGCLAFNYNKVTQECDFIDSAIATENLNPTYVTGPQMCGVMTGQWTFLTSKSCRKLPKNISESYQKYFRKLSKNISESCQKYFSSTSLCCSVWNTKNTFPATAAAFGSLYFKKFLKQFATFLFFRS
jgi:hypothetical protein